MKKLTLILTVFILIFSLTNCSDGVKKVKLEYKFKPSMVLTYKQAGISNYSIISKDTVITDKKNEYTIDIQYSFNNQINDSTFEILESSDWIYYKSKEDHSEGIDTVTVHREMILRQLKNGRIVDFDYISEERTKRSYIKNYFEQGSPVFPKESVGMGHSWTQSYKVVLPDETMEASTTYNIKSFVKESGYDCVILEFNGNLLIPFEADPEDESQRQGIDRISTTGELYFAYNEGFVVLQKENWIIQGDRSMLRDSGIHEYKIESEYNVEFKLVKAEGI